LVLRKPNVVEPFAGIAPLYAAFLTVAAEALWVSTPFQSWDTL
jgi:hypothetical protein